MFHAPKRHIDHVASTVAFVLVLCTWVVGYGIVCPPDAAHHPVHIASVQR